MKRLLSVCLLVAMTASVVFSQTKLTISSSSSGPAQTASTLAHDGNTTTRYGNDNTLASAWIQFNLSAAASISQVRLMMYSGATRTYPIKIEVGTTQVWSGTTTASASFVTYSFTPTTGQSVKITMTGANSAGSNWFSIFEAEIYTPSGVQTYTLTPSAGANGTITPNTVQTVNSGSDFTFNFSGNTGYTVDQVKVDNVVVTPTTPTTYKFVNVTANHTINVTFKTSPVQTYTLTPSVGANGTITPNTPQTVNSGSDFTFNFNGNSGFIVDQVKVDNVVVTPTTSTSYKFVNVTANHTINVTFVAVPTCSWSCDGSGMLYTNGNVGIGGSPNSSYKLTVNGGLFANSMNMTAGLVGSSYTPGYITIGTPGGHSEMYGDHITTSGALNAGSAVVTGSITGGSGSFADLAVSNGISLTAGVVGCSVTPGYITIGTPVGHSEMYGDHITTSGVLNGGSAAITGVLNAGSAVISGNVTAASATLTSASVTGDLTCNAVRLGGTYSWATLQSGSLSVGTVGGSTDISSGNITATATITGQVLKGDTVIVKIAKCDTLRAGGGVVTKQVRLTQSGWSDFVFDKGYMLMPLNKVEKYIARNGHLPNVPSAQEVQKNGVDVANVQATLLRKIEELTLHMIKQQKQLDRITTENARLKARVEELNQK